MKLLQPLPRPHASRPHSPALEMGEVTLLSAGADGFDRFGAKPARGVLDGDLLNGGLPKIVGGGSKRPPPAAKPSGEGGGRSPPPSPVGFAVGGGRLDPYRRFSADPH